MATKRPRVHLWVTFGVLLGTAFYAIAEDLTLVTYYPSPRGVYNELRTRGNVQVGSITTPPAAPPPPRLHVVGGADTTQVLITANATQSNTNPLLRVLASDGTTELFRLHSDSTLNLFLGNGAGRLNTTSGGLNGLYNTFIGSTAGFSNTTGFFNTATGARALESNTTGTDNTATGARALESNTTGGGNTATGSFALRVNTTGGGNTATGSRTLIFNTTGDDNTATGAGTLSMNTTGDDNTATGSNALRVNDTGRSNTATGSFALYTNTTGSYNTANGMSALYSNTTGLRNTANGYNSLWSNTTGANNIAVGYQAGDNITTGSNNIVIGFNIDSPTPSVSNRLTIGNLIFGTGVDGTGTTISAGNVGIGTTAPAQKLHVSGSGVGANIARIRVSSTNNQAGIGFLSDNAGEVVVYSPDGTNDLRFWLGADRLSVTSGGNVGIGTTAPGSRLHVRGAGSGLGATTWALNVTDGVGVSHLLVHDNGQVGIGMTIMDPTYLLHVGSGIGGVGGARIDGQLYVDGPITATGPKAFRIAHPLRPAEGDLIHAAIEGPEAGVYYRGEAVLANGEATIVLPAYFEALTRPEGRTVLVTPKGTTPFLVSATEVREGRFSVYGTNTDGAFYWEVKAVRADVPPLEVEVDKEGR